jgi:fosfomycin resistance protein FosX
MIEGLSHITFIVRDLDRMEEILVSVLGARKVYDSGEENFSLSRERFYLAGSKDAPLWLAAMEGESLSTRSYNHVAFKISETDYPACLERVQALGLEVREGRPRIEGEGRSIYFHDHDNHLFELHTGTLEERLRRI